MNLKRLWTRKPKSPTQIYLKGMGVDNYAAIPVRLIFPDAPMKIDHTIIHTAYPHPDTITITLYDLDGRQFVMPPINCRGGVYYPMQIPDWDGTKWVKMDVKVYYQ
jgi:hypothetical protein